MKPNNCVYSTQCGQCIYDLHDSNHIRILTRESIENIICMIVEHKSFNKYLLRIKDNEIKCDGLVYIVRINKCDGYKDEDSCNSKSVYNCNREYIISIIGHWLDSDPAFSSKLDLECMELAINSISTCDEPSKLSIIIKSAYRILANTSINYNNLF